MKVNIRVKVRGAKSPRNEKDYEYHCVYVVLCVFDMGVGDDSL